MSAKIIVLEAHRVRMADAADEEPCDLTTAIDVAIRDLREILQTWGSEEARARVIECERMLSRVSASEAKAFC